MPKITKLCLTFVEVMERKLWPLFFRRRCSACAHRARFGSRVSYHAHTLLLLLLLLVLLKKSCTSSAVEVLSASVQRPLGVVVKLYNTAQMSA